MVLIMSLTLFVFSDLLITLLFLVRISFCELCKAYVIVQICVYE